MKKLIGLCLSTVILLVSCGTDDTSGNQNPDSNYFEGYVSQIEDQRVLVTEKRANQPYNQIPIEEAYNEVGEAIFFNVKSIDQTMVDSLVLGEKVKVEHLAVAESYPAQSQAVSISRVVDEQHDLITNVNENQNVVELSEWLLQKGELRKASYTVEGDPIFTTVRTNDQLYEVFVDATQDQYGNASKPMKMTCESLETSLVNQQLETSFKNCDNESHQLLLLMAKPNHLIVPEQQYTAIEINSNGEELVTVTDTKQIKSWIAEIKKGKKTSVAVMSMMKPDGTITLKGERVSLIYDYYKSGGIVAYNVFIEAKSIK